MVGRSSGILGLSGVLHQGYIATVPIHNIGHRKQPAVREVHEVLAISVGTGPALLVAEVIVGHSIVHSILPQILGISLGKRIKHSLVVS